MTGTRRSTDSQAPQRRSTDAGGPVPGAVASLLTEGAEGGSASGPDLRGLGRLDEG